MNLLEPSLFKVLTFDCYGTLIDWDRGLLDLLTPWAKRHGLRCRPQDLLLRHSHHEPRLQEAHPDHGYPDILAGVLRRIGADFGVEVSDGEAARYGASVGGWPVFADSPAALARLAGRYRLVVLSNVDNASLERSRHQLGDPFCAAVTAEAVGAYKPDRRMFDAALEVAAGLGAEPGEVLHVAQSLFHDHVPAAGMGLASIWVDRQGESGQSTAAAIESAAPLATVRDLTGVAELLGC